MAQKIKPYLCNKKDSTILDLIDAFHRDLKVQIDLIKRGKYVVLPALYEKFHTLFFKFHNDLKRELASNLDDQIRSAEAIQISPKKRQEKRALLTNGTKLFQSSLDILEPSLKKMHTLVSRYLTQKAETTPVKLPCRFTCAEIGAITHLSYLEGTKIHKISNLITTDRPSPVRVVSEKIYEAEKIQQRINKEIIEHPTFETGDILLEDENRRASCDKEIAFNVKAIFQKLFSFDFEGLRKIIIGIITHLTPEKLFDLRSVIFGKYVHAAVAIKKAASTSLSIAEITKSFRAARIDGKDSIVNRAFRPNFHKIATKEALLLIAQTSQNSEAMTEAQIIGEIARLYRRLSEEMLEGNEDKWSSIKFSQENAFKTLIPKLMNKKRGEETILSNKETSPSKRQLFCSEFVVRFTHNVFKMLEEEIRTKYNIGQEIKIFHEVFPEDLDFERTTPGHLRDIFRKYFDKVERPKIIDALFDLPKKSTHVKA